jgi:hypothetical protein
VERPQHSGAPIPGHYIVVLKDSVADPAAVAKEHGQKYGVQRTAPNLATALAR